MADRPISAEQRQSKAGMRMKSSRRKRSIEAVVSMHSAAATTYAHDDAASTRRESTPTLPSVRGSCKFKQRALSGGAGNVRWRGKQRSQQSHSSSRPARVGRGGQSSQGHAESVWRTREARDGFGLDAAGSAGQRQRTPIAHARKTKQSNGLLRQQRARAAADS